MSSSSLAFLPRLALLATGLVLLLATGLHALAETHGETILTLSLDGEEQSLTLAEIEASELHEVQMQHPEGLEGIFSGVWLDDFLAAHGLDEARRVRFIARDDYTTFLTPEQRAEKDYLLVTRLDGEPLSFDQQGPLMLIVPEDAEAVVKGTEPMTRWIWAIDEISAR